MIERQTIYRCKRNIEVLSCNRLCHGKAVNISFSECVPVALVIQNELCYEGKSIIKLEIVIEKKRIGIMTYKQHLFFNVISIHI